METIKRIQELNQKLSLIQAFEALKISFSGKPVSKEIKKKIEEEINRYKRRRIQEIDQASTIDESINSDLIAFNLKEISVLKKMAQRVIQSSEIKEKKTEKTKIKDLDIPKKENNNNVLSEVIRKSKEKRQKVVYDDIEYEILAKTNTHASVIDSNGNKRMLPINKLKFL